MDTKFDYFEAFSRNLGFVSVSEQKKIQNTTVAIAGAGGAGSGTSMALARLGFGKFKIADLDYYEVANFNRQLGATMSSVGKDKTSVIERMIKDINPEAVVTRFDQGISPENIDEFLDGVDVVVDALDFYCFKERMFLFPAARKKGLWVFNSPPLGFGCALLGFDPEGMTFEDYFGFTDDMEQERWVELLMAGLSPDQFLMQYLDKRHLDFEGKTLPSVGIGVFFLSAFVATEIVKLISEKQTPIAVPKLLQFDAMLMQMKITEKSMDD